MYHKIKLLCFLFLSFGFEIVNWLWYVFTCWSWLELLLLKLREGLRFLSTLGDRSVNLNIVIDFHFIASYALVWFRSCWYSCVTNLSVSGMFKLFFSFSLEFASWIVLNLGVWWSSNGKLWIFYHNFSSLAACLGLNLVLTLHQNAFIMKLVFCLVLLIGNSVITLSPPDCGWWQN